MTGFGAAELLGWTDEALAELARLRGWTEQAIEQLELEWDARAGQVRFPIKDATNDELGALLYLPDPATRNGRRKMRQPAGVPRQLFPPPETLEQDGRELVVTEGEPDQVAAFSAGFAAVAVPGVEGWRPEYAVRFSGRRWTVHVVGDCDDEGRDFARRVAASLVEAGVDARIVDLDPDRDDKYDLTEFLLEHGAGELRELLDAAEPYDATSAAPPARPYALPLDEFIAAKSDLPAALLGDAVETILAAVGLVILFGRGGRGKTTLTVEAALHLASGIAWLVFAVGRPLRILLIENEGPRELFREKLERKLASWPHELTGAIFVYTESWGAFTLADDDGAAIERLRAFVAANQIDLVIGDPLDTLGVAGVGSPEQTRDFVALMVAAGLSRDVAFWLLHHPRKERAEDELDELAGAWGGKPDTVMRLDVQPGDRARLSFPKIRWRRRSLRPPLILEFDPETESYSVVGEEGEERDLVAEIEELLGDGKWRIVKEIAAPKEPKEEGDMPGVGAGDRAVKQALEENPDRFESRTGDEAVELGRRRDATVWQKRRWPQNADNADNADPGRKSESGVQRQASIDAERCDAPFRQTEAASAPNAAPLDDALPDEVERLAELARELEKDDA